MLNGSLSIESLVSSPRIFLKISKQEHKKWIHSWVISVKMILTSEATKSMFSLRHSCCSSHLYQASSLSTSCRHKSESGDDSERRNQIPLSGRWETFSHLRQPRSLTALTSLTPSPPSPVRVTSISLLQIRRVPYFPTDPLRRFEGHRQNPKTYLGETWTLKYVRKSRWTS